MEEIAAPGLVAAPDAERQANAIEVAEIFTEAFGEPDAAEAALENLLLDCEMHDAAFWREVTIALTQFRE